MPRWTDDLEAAIEENLENTCMTRELFHHPWAWAWACSHCRRHRPQEPLPACNLISQGQPWTCSTPTARKRELKQPQPLQQWPTWQVGRLKLQRWRPRKLQIGQRQFACKCDRGMAVGHRIIRCLSSFREGLALLLCPSVEEPSSSGCQRLLLRHQRHPRGQGVLAGKRGLKAPVQTEREEEVAGTRRCRSQATAARQWLHPGLLYLQGPGPTPHLRRKLQSLTVSRVLVTVTRSPLPRHFMLRFCVLSRSRQKERGSCVTLVSFHAAHRTYPRAQRS
mmetsp:Transcript_251/g.859  ORF Transcript_251/g.859 Transcript_251/m.859 type:complete len:278 (+) Transcript_251:1483-2316(+)